MSLNYDSINLQIELKIIQVSNIPRDFLTSNSEFYCTAVVEHQEVQTNISKPIISNIDKPLIFWDQSFVLDIISFDDHLKFAIWRECNNSGKCLGECHLNLNIFKNSTQKVHFLQLSGSSNFTLDISLLCGHTEQKRITIDDFELLRVVGRGNFGKVMQCRKKDSNRLYAIKVLRKERLIETNSIQNTLVEKKILQAVKHPFVVSLKYSFQTADKLYIVIDYVAGGELFFHLSREQWFPENKSLFYTAELVLALEYIHNLGVIYRDLKPENVLIDMAGHVVLVDFGLAKQLEKGNTRTFTLCGSPPYLAPEMLTGVGYTQSIDWWALGCLLYEMMTGLPPFYDEDDRKIPRMILHQQLVLDPAIFSNDCRLILSQFLHRNPTKRLGANGAQEVKSHSLFKNINWDLLMQKKIEPPFIPHLQHTLDVRYFDREFTSQPANDSYVNPSVVNKIDQKLFAGFTYVAPEDRYMRRPQYGMNTSTSTRHRVFENVSTTNEINQLQLDNAQSAVTEEILKVKRNDDDTGPFSFDDF
eukprot:TRINITY_DN1746_c0_g4_i1.p1 TRINITY_DN1746_c0_g4~~TRINITY_DN1746_c0_g4_i1.p1  ORF type:complete len:530 (-),score=166.51 TRINITY_DN1746_c0_g4_i1:112-1701(-)